MACDNRLLRKYSATFCLLVIFAVATVLVHGQNGGKRKEASQLAEKVGQLSDLSAKRPVLRFNGKCSFLTYFVGVDCSTFQFIQLLSRI